MRQGFYQAALSPALFAVATACALVGLALRSARILAKAEDDVRIAREKARVSEERLGLALSSGHEIGTWDWHIVQDRLIVDERFARLYGMAAGPASEGLSMTQFYRSIHPDDLSRVKTSIAATARLGTAFREEYRVNGLDERYCWVLGEGRTEVSVEGAPVRLTGVSFDISDQKLSQLHQSALLTLSDELRSVTDVNEIAFQACRILGATLGVSRVGYGLVNTQTETIAIERDWNADGVKSLAGVLHFRDYGSYINDLKRGETVVFEDAKLDPRTRANADALIAISARAVVNMPLVEQQGFVALLYANNAEVRLWREADLSLMRQFADRVRGATERVRADLARRLSEEQFRVFAHAVPNHIWAEIE